MYLSCCSQPHSSANSTVTHQITVVRPLDPTMPIVDNPNVTEHFVSIDNSAGTVWYMTAENPAK